MSSRSTRGSAGVFDLDLTGCGVILGAEGRSQDYSSNINAQYFVGEVLNNDGHSVGGFLTPDEWTDVTLNARAQTDGHVQLEVIYDHPSRTREDKQFDLPRCKLSDRTLFVGLGFHCSDGTRDIYYDDLRVSWE